MVTSLPKSLLALIESALNRYFQLDPERAARFAGIEDKIIAVQLTDLGWVFYLQPGDSRLKVLDLVARSADTTLAGTSIALLQMGLRDSASDSLFAGEVRIDGDVELGQAFQEILHAIDVDWEEILSHYTGDIIAHQVGNGVRGFMQWGEKTVESLRQDLSDYLKEESQLLPAPEQIQDFVKDVDELRMDVDRLQQRVQRLQDKR